MKALALHILRKPLKKSEFALAKEKPAATSPPHIPL
ncbi:MAG: hypothetical protein RL015_1215 [Verrucomicrobiota bacterium]|jgi:hypothetical protein